VIAGHDDHVPPRLSLHRLLHVCSFVVGSGGGL
jgi:hypothetical protein